MFFSSAQLMFFAALFIILFPAYYFLDLIRRRVLYYGMDGSCPCGIQPKIVYFISRAIFLKGMLCLLWLNLAAEFALLSSALYGLHVYGFHYFTNASCGCISLLKAVGNSAAGGCIGLLIMHFALQLSPFLATHIF